MKYIRIVLLFISITAFVFSQEGLRPLGSNPNLIYSSLYKEKKTLPAMNLARTSTATIDLPFFDDFYYASFSNYPDQSKWSDSLLYINTGMGRAPLTIGVATFDGLNKYGYPYDPNATFTSSQANPADTLTSQPINLFVSGTTTLQPLDSVALIFYYQRTGNGDSPEAQDSLVIDFYKPFQDTWNSSVWSLKGNTNPNNADTLFTRGFVWVDDTAYLHDGFKFRFRNKAGTNGNFDNWHIDYVYLDKGRSMINDTAWNDLSIGYVPSPFLKRYHAMPFNQYVDYEMGNNYSNYIRYNGTSTVNTTYQYSIYDQSNNLIHNQSFGALNLGPFKTDGWQNNPVHSFPALDYTFTAMTDSTDYIIKHYMLNLGGDINLGNDTVYQPIKFRNYFAYDDGSCETGYYVLGTGGKMAYKYVLNQTDTLRALRIYFDPVGSIALTESAYNFRINVYQDGGSAPGLLIYKDSLMQPKYLSEGVNAFVEYQLTTPLVLNQGNWFVGIQQFVAAGITIGFDKNFDASSNLYYDSGNGWTQSSYYGSLMLRPVFGRKIEPQVGLAEAEIPDNQFQLFPNPTNGRITIKSRFESAIYSIHDISGKQMKQGSLTEKQMEIDCNSLPEGIYFIEVTDGVSTLHKKFIKN